jgi:UDP-N-acetylmuramate: L-alanyl-gamma-D-glutamyl-meso-diaminopimelate ligase
MHNLALALHNRVSGNGGDDAIFEPSKSRLIKGILPAELGWFSEKITKILRR